MVTVTSFRCGETEQIIKKTRGGCDRQTAMSPPLSPSNVPSVVAPPDLATALGRSGARVVRTASIGSRFSSRPLSSSPRGPAARIRTTLVSTAAHDSSLFRGLEGTRQRVPWSIAPGSSKPAGVSHPAVILCSLLSGSIS